jgi:multiple sugar transport system substrate-binding protein
MNQPAIELRGVTWGHTRGYVPLVATAQRFEELHPDVRISWSRRSLEDFSNRPLEQYAQNCDLLLISHTWAGHIAETKVIEPLDEWFSQAFLKDQASHSVGRSHESYYYNDSQWALAIDTAAPVAAARNDLLEALIISAPETWEDVVVLAEQGKVAAPFTPLDTLMHFYMLCATLGDEACRSDKHLVGQDTGLKALELLGELTSFLNPKCFEWNPIQVYEAMTQTDDYAYCPFAYGYSNYARRRYARRTLKFADLVTLSGSDRLLGPLGGAGIAISASSQNKWMAAEYAEFVSSSEMQKGYYVEFGGQPSYRSAWTGRFANATTDNYFIDTLPAVDRAFLRPRYRGHMNFQAKAGVPIREFLMNGGSPIQVLNHLDKMFVESKRSAS